MILAGHASLFVYNLLTMREAYCWKTLPAYIHILEHQCSSLSRLRTRLCGLHSHSLRHRTAGVCGTGQEKEGENELVGNSNGKDNETIASERIRGLEEREEFGKRREDLWCGPNGQLSYRGVKIKPIPRKHQSYP
jgi:hypothetical protein